MKVTLGTLSKAVKAIQDYRRDLLEKMDKLRELVAYRIGADAAHIFNQSYVDLKEGLPGEPRRAEVDVTITNKGDMSVVIADGEDAVFVEFGAGVYSNAKPSPHPLGTETGMTIGSYGKGYGNRKTWGFYNENGELELTHGTPATMPMYTAMKNVADNIYAIAREVFE